MSQSPNPLTTAIRATHPALITAFCISVFINLAMFASPLYSLQVFDRVLSSRNLGTLAMLTIIAAVFLLLYGILEYARSGVLSRGGVRFNNSIAKPVYALAMRAELSGRPSAAAQALKDADTIRDCLSGSIVSSLFDVPWTPVFVGICYLFHPILGAVALTGALLIFACAILTEVMTKKTLDTVGKKSAEAGHFATTGLRNSETAKGLGMTDAIATRWIAMQSKMLFAQSSAHEKAAIMLSATKVLRMAIQIALIGTGAWLAIDRLISPGVMMAAMIIMGRALSPIEQIVANWKRIVAYRSAVKRLDELFRQSPEPAVATLLPEARGDLAVENLVLRTSKGGLTIVKDTTFAIQAGTAVGVIGPSGGGKSSLIKALAGIWTPALGVVRLDGAALGHWDAAQLGRSIGYLPQDVSFFPGTIAENIARLGTPDDAAVIAAAVAAGVHSAILKQPNGYQTVLGDGEVVLSGGMRQRLALARAMYGNPRVVIMDEPNSNLDTEGEAALVAAMKQMKSDGRTVVVVTHKPQLLAHVDTVLVMSAGRVQTVGNRDEVMNPPKSNKVTELRPAKPVDGSVGHQTVSRAELTSLTTAAYVVSHSPAPAS
jgi:PrtD family type I secretion system ABC transporter